MGTPLSLDGKTEAQVRRAPGGRGGSFCFSNCMLDACGCCNKSPPMHPLAVLPVRGLPGPKARRGHPGHLLEAPGGTQILASPAPRGAHTSWPMAPPPSPKPAGSGHTVTSLWPSPLPPVPPIRTLVFRLGPPVNPGSSPYFKGS